MVIGHVGAAAFVRLRHREVGWPLLITATFFADLVEVALDLVAVRKLSSEQYSHSLPILIAGAALAAILVARSGLPGNARWTVAALVLSHAPLDWITGRTKPFLWAFGPEGGLGLYRIPVADAVLECTLLLVPAVLILRRQRPKRTRVFLSFVAALVAIQLTVAAAGQFRPVRIAIKSAIRPIIRSRNRMRRMIRPPRTEPDAGQRRAMIPRSCSIRAISSTCSSTSPPVVSITSSARSGSS